MEFVERSGRAWLSAPNDPDETDEVIRAAASGEVSEADLRDPDRRALRVALPSAQ